jgi:hypothetical protein
MNITAIVVGIILILSPIFISIFLDVQEIIWFFMMGIGVVLIIFALISIRGVIEFVSTRAKIVGSRAKLKDFINDLRKEMNKL